MKLYKVTKKGFPPIELVQLKTVSKLTGIKIDRLYYCFGRKKLNWIEEEGYKIKVVKSKDIRVTTFRDNDNEKIKAWDK